MQYFNSSKGYVGIVLILGIALIGGLTMIGGLLPGKKKPPTIAPIEEGQLKEIKDNKAEQGLQLKAIGPDSKSPTRPPVTTSAPTPLPTINACGHNSVPSQDPTCICQTWKYQCENGACKNVISHPSYGNLDLPNDCKVPFGVPSKKYFDDQCKSKFTSSGKRPDGYYCVAKPVIYLYPEKETLVDVSVKTEGKIVVSDPLYPPGGWKNVLAYPSGKLVYQGKEYRELFYESETSDIKAPGSGLVAETENIEKILKELNHKLGLSDFESKELTDFWVPRLRNLASPYLLVSLIQGEEKDRIDQIFINPKPDTFIEVLYYFRPLEKEIKIKPLILPQTPQRRGFTAVEWGGTIDLNR